MKKIVVIGAGGLAREIKFLIDEINRSQSEFKFLGYIVSDLSKLTEVDSKDEVLGDFNWFKYRTDKIHCAIGMGNPTHRLKISSEITIAYPNVLFPTLIHPNVIYDPNSCEFGKGSIICAGNMFTVNVTVEPYALINLDCTIGHESVIGEGSVINPSVNISGGVKIEEGVLVGTGAQILQYLTIGSNSVIGSAACVVKSVLPKTTVVGIPAKPMK